MDLCHNDVSCHATFISSGKVSSQSITLMHVALVFLHLKKFFYRHFQFIDEIFRQASSQNWGATSPPPPMPSSSPVQYASDDSEKQLVAAALCKYELSMKRYSISISNTSMYTVHGRP